MSRAIATSRQIATARILRRVGSFSTTFPLTENPISEGGAWTNLGSNLVMRTTTNKAFGTGASGNDAIATLTGVFTANQEASGTVFNTIASDTGSDNTFFTEVEIHLRTTPGASYTTTYECLFSVNPSDGYVEIVKWLPSVGGFISLTGTVGASPVGNGDIVRATIIGNTITQYVNGVQVNQATDNASAGGVAAYTTGNPGMGHWLHNGGGIQAVRSDYGYSRFSATNS